MGLKMEEEKTIEDDFQMESSRPRTTLAVTVTTTATHTSPDRSSCSPRVRSRRVGSIDVEKGAQQQQQLQQHFLYNKYPAVTPLRSRSFSGSSYLQYQHLLLEQQQYSPTKQQRERKNSWETRGNPIQRIRVKWNVMSKRFKFLTICIASTILWLTTVSLLDNMYKSYQTQPFRNHDVSFVVVMNTYKRPDQLAGGVRHYAETCGRQYGVAHVHIIWAETDTVPPHPDVFYLDPQSVSNRAGVSYRRVKNSLNSRFLEIPGVTGPVFMVDDDIRVDCASLIESFRAWKANPDSMVGYYPRLAKKKRDTTFGYVYQSWPSIFFHGRMNMVLSKACFLHSRFMELYSSEQHPQAIRDYVDQYFNCEDVAMSMLVANMTRYENHRAAKPIYVEAKVSDMGLFHGISTGTGHFAHRSECLNKLTEIYQQHGWEAPLDDSFLLQESSWVKHVPGFWWQMQSSNLFEWAAIENIWT